MFTIRYSKTSRTLLTIGLMTLLAGIAHAQNIKKVTRGEAMSAALSKVQPDYPATARQLKIEGTVEIEATVGEGGTVEQVQIVSGNPVLTRSASDAVKKWKFTPFKVDGKPVRAVAPLSFSFKL